MTLGAGDFAARTRSGWNASPRHEFPLGDSAEATSGGVRPMPDRMQDGQQPEALRSLKSAAKAGSRKPQEQGLEARGDTAPISAPLEQEQDAAAKVLQEGVEKNPSGMEDAARKAPKR